MHEIDAERGIRQGMPEAIPLWMSLLVCLHGPPAGQKAEEHNDGCTVERHHGLQHGGRVAKRFVKDLDLQQEVDPHCRQGQDEALHNPFAMAQDKRSCLLQVQCGQSSENEVELVGQQKATLIRRYHLPHPSRSQRALLEIAIIKIHEEDLQGKADKECPPGMFVDLNQQEQEQGQHQVELDREQDVVELVGGIPGQNIEECQSGKRPWRVL